MLGRRKPAKPPAYNHHFPAFAHRSPHRAPPSWDKHSLVDSMQLHCHGILSHKPRLTGSVRRALTCLAVTNAMTLDAIGTGMTLTRPALVSRLAVLTTGIS